MSSEWHTTQDFESDIWALSEMEGATRSHVDVAPPATILEWNARVGANNSPSVFDAPAVQEDVTYVVSGRGRGGISTLIQPGIAPQPNRNVDDDLRRRLREVSGLGYSNELIVQSLRENSNRTRTVTPEIKLQPIEPLNSSFSRRSTPNSTVDSTKSAVNSTKSSPSTTPKKSTASDLSVSPSSSSSALSDSSSSESKPEELTQEPPAPLPLSVMLNRAKKQKEVEQPKKSPKATLKENRNTQIRQNGVMEVDENINTNQNHSDGVSNANDFWWRNRNTDSSSDESNCWRRRDGNSPNRYFGVKNRNSIKNFNLNSSKEFPALK